APTHILQPVSTYAHSTSLPYTTLFRSLFMNAGDQLDISIHDSADGLVTEIHDLTTGQSGSMTASVANGFAQVNYDPTATTCTQRSEEHTSELQSHLNIVCILRREKKKR